MSQDPYYEKNAFQAYLATFIGILLTVASMFSKAIVAHWLLVFAWVSGSITVWKACFNIGLPSTRIAATGLLSICLAAVLFAVDRYIVPSPPQAPITATTAPPIKARGPGSANRNPSVPINIGTVTLEDLFYRDLTGATSICGGKTLGGSPILPSIHIATCSSLDFKTNTVVFGYYIPFSNNTARVVRDLLALVDVRQAIKEDLAIKVEGKAPEDSTVRSSEDLVFPGLVYIYHEKEMDAESIGDLTRLYSAQKLKAQFRSQSYLELRKLQARETK